MKILILGISGMLGNAMFRTFSSDNNFSVVGTLRSSSSAKYFADTKGQILTNIDLLDNDKLVSLVEEVKPDTVINCVGLIKQLSDSSDPLVTLPINSMLPHRLDKLCSLANARLIHISTDCVFSGNKGQYKETDLSDAKDLYGKSKFIGELHNSKNAVTLRTSIIGHELFTNNSLVDWFLEQKDAIKGYQKAVFSGLPTNVLSELIKEYVIPNKSLTGLYHVSADPIDKFTLLKIISEVYNKEIKIIPDSEVVIDRSLDSSKFREATGYLPPDWRVLINKMSESRYRYV